MGCGWSVGGFWLDCGGVWMVYGWALDGLWMDCGSFVDGLRKVGDGFWMDCGGLVGQASWGARHLRICRVYYA